MKKKKPDYTLLGISLLFLFLGILFLAGVSAVPSQMKTGRPDYFLLRYLLFGILPGLTLGVIAYNMKIAWFRKWAGALFAANLILVAAVFIPGIGITAGGATRWLNFHFFSFQPTELLKVTFILYLAAWFSGRPFLKKKASAILPFFLILFFIGILLRFQPDMSTLGVLVVSALSIYFAADTPFWHFLIIAALIIVLFTVFIFFSEYRMERILLYLGLRDDPMGIGFQIKQSIISIGSGGIFGQGLGSYTQKPGFLPQTIGDSIFSVIAEETGFIGSVLLVIMFLSFLWRSLKTAQKSKDMFLSLTALGIGVWICFQGFVNIGAMIGVVPITGIPLPFISYGGSHIISELIAVGILLNISKHS